MLLALNPPDSNVKPQPEELSSHEHLAEVNRWRNSQT